MAQDEATLTVGTTVDTLDIGPYSMALDYQGRDAPTGDRRSQPVNHYTLTVEGPEGDASFPYWDSVHATENQTPGEAADAFHSLVLDVLHVVTEYDGPHDADLDNRDFIEGFGEFCHYQGFSEGNAEHALDTWMQMNKHACDLLYGVGLTEDHLYTLGNAPKEEIETVTLEADQ